MKPFTRGSFAELPLEPRRAHSYFDMEVRELQLETSGFGKVRVHVRFAGKGPPLLLVHGLMTSSYSFRYVLELLGAHFRLIVPDLPGAGRSERVPQREHSPRAFANLLSTLVDALGIRGCAALGNSMGGYLCMHAALQDETLFGRLVNLHSPGLADARMKALSIALSVPGIETVLARVFGLSPKRFVHKNVHYYDESLKSLEEAEEYGSVLADPAGAVCLVRYLREALGARDMRLFEQQLQERRDRGQAFPVPLMLVYADKDPMVPPAIGDRLKALCPDSTFVKLADTSHFAHVDTPERLVNAVLPFLNPA